MASSSSSSVKNSFKYDVFLSFRGEDTRKTFVDHLHLALVNKGIITYKDDQTIEKGERIDDQLIRSIEESRSYIIVFSKNYADSSWCLQELVKIMECQKTKEQTAYPVFYDVEPTEVRNQSGAVGEAFAKHVQNPAAGKWRDALKEAASLAGWELKNTFDGHEAKFIQKIVKEISLKLHVINWSIDEKLVGMEERVKNVISSLEVESEDDVRMIGIWGMGGAGKTTLARAVFDHISIWFEGNSFVENVRECSKRSLSGLKKLQRQVLKDVLNDQSIDVTSVADGINKMKKMMPGRKVLVVLDDVDDIDQLEALAGNSNWFKPGSRIIITTRDKQVLIAQGVNVDNIYNISLLSREEAICLFSRHAFSREVPNQGYEELSQQVVYYADGLPLTIKVLGSFLCGKTEWVDTLERLKTIPLEKTLTKLEISYDGLEKDQKEIFLDVACILKGEQKDNAIRILESCGFHAQIGLEVLEQKSLLVISNYGYLDMHDHIEEMGKNIVRRSHPNEPKRHSRLWVKEEIEEILINDLGTEATRSMNLRYLGIHPAIVMKSLRKMKKIRLLSVLEGRFDSKIWEIDEGRVQYLPNTLQSLCWPNYPFCCLPKTFQANNLVNLEMPWSYISQLWEGGERMVELRFVDLCYSKLRTYDLGMTRNLKRLDLSHCVDLVELQMPVALPMLDDLNLSYSKVGNLNLGMTPNIKKLCLKRCVDLVELQMPVALPMLNDLDLGHSKVSNLNLGMTPNIRWLCLKGCKDLVELQMPVALPMLEGLELDGSKVSNLNLGLTPNIETLDLHGCEDLVELQMPVALPMLKRLDLGGSKVSNLILGMAPNIKKLDLHGCEDLVELQMPVALPMLKRLDLGSSKVSNLNLGMTPNIKKLYLHGCEDLVELQMPVALPMLHYLKLSNSKVSNLNLGLTPDLWYLELIDCNYLQEIHAPMGSLKNLEFLDLSNCLRFKYVRVNTTYDSPPRDSLGRLKLSAQSLDICPLHPNSNLPKFMFKCEYGEVLPSSSGNLEKLLSFGLCACTNLESFSVSICSLQKLTKLTLKGSIPEAPKDLWKLESLETLILSMKKIKHLPDNICMLKHLKYLYLESCEHLEQLPMDLGGLECLEQLHVTYCDFLRDLPDSICKMKHLKCLVLESCEHLEQLPMDLGGLECLEQLQVGDCKSLRDIPDSICKMKHLKYLVLESCEHLEQLPMDLGGLECLEHLQVRDCKSLRDIPDSICQMKRLKYLNLCRCIQVEKLPKEVGRLECLEYLNLEGAGVSCLPESIFELKDLRIWGLRGNLSHMVLHP